MKKLPILLFLSLLFTGCSDGLSELQKEISCLTENFPAEVGVAVVHGKDTICFNADAHFPMFSVVKFPQALTVIRNAQLDDTLTVTAEELKPDTWSPMREKFPDGGSFTVRQIVEYALIESDNNASDILFNRYDCPKDVESHLHSNGIKGCGIKWTEDDQHKDPQRCYDNWITPKAAVQLLCLFYDAHDNDESARFIWSTMSNCNTGTNRIPKYISDQAISIVHKTGTGFVLEDGTVTGINDIGCIILPDGRHFELAVLIKDAKCGAAECEELIARIAYAACNFLTVK